MINFNPLKPILVTRYSPYSEILRSNFKQKMVDTFQLNVITILSKLLISAILVIPALPIVAAAHAASSFIARKYFKKALMLEVELTSHENGKWKLDKMPLEKALNKVQKKISYVSQDAALHGDYLGPGMSDPCNIGEHYHGGLFLMPSERPTDKDQNEALEAALHLNLFGYTNGLEEHISEENILPKPPPKLKGI